MTKDWLTIEAAVTLTIERDPDCSPPFHYQSYLGGDVIMRLQGCVESSENLLESHKAADEHHRRICGRRLEHAKFVLARAKQLHDDLHQEMYRYLSGEDSLLQWRTPDEAQEPQINKHSLVAWAYKTHEIDVDGFHARREGRKPPLSPRYTDQISTVDVRRIQKRIMVSPDQLWRIFKESDEREQLFLRCVLMLEVYLDGVEPCWRKEIIRQGLQSIGQIYDAGVVQPSKIGAAVNTETGLSTKSTETLVKRLLQAILDESDAKDAISDRERKKAHQFVLGIALSIAAQRKALLSSAERGALRRDPEAIMQLIKKRLPEDVAEKVRSALTEACQFLAT